MEHRDVELPFEVNSDAVTGTRVSNVSLRRHTSAASASDSTVSSRERKPLTPGPMTTMLLQRKPLSPSSVEAEDAKQQAAITAAAAAQVLDLPASLASAVLVPPPGFQTAPPMPTDEGADVREQALPLPPARRQVGVAKSPGFRAEHMVNPSEQRSLLSPARNTIVLDIAEPVGTFVEALPVRTRLVQRSRRMNPALHRAVRKLSDGATSASATQDANGLVPSGTDAASPGTIALKNKALSPSQVERVVQRISISHTQRRFLSKK